MNRNLSLLLICIAVWLLWSGLTVEISPVDGSLHLNPMLAGLGLGSCLLVSWLSSRLSVVDREGHPYHLAVRVLRNLPWLIREVVTSNLAVARIIVSRDMPIHSHLIRVPASQRTIIGQVIHANTITLTPGTLTLDLRDGELLVHALTREAGDPAQSKALDEKICQLEGNA